MEIPIEIETYDRGEVVSSLLRQNGLTLKKKEESQTMLQLDMKVKLFAKQRVFLKKS